MAILGNLGKLVGKLVQLGKLGTFGWPIWIRENHNCIQTHKHRYKDGEWMTDWQMQCNLILIYTYEGTDEIIVLNIC